MFVIFFLKNIFGLKALLLPKKNGAPLLSCKWLLLKEKAGLIGKPNQKEQKFLKLFHGQDPLVLSGTPRQWMVLGICIKKIQEMILL